MGRLVPKNVETDITIVVMEMLYMTQDSRNTLMSVAASLSANDQRHRGERAVDRALAEAEQMADYAVRHLDDHTPVGDTTDPRLDG